MMSSMKTSCTCTLHYLLLLILINNYARDTSALSNLEDGVQLYVQDNHVVMDNGLVQVNISNPSGLVTEVQYNGIDDLLEILNEEQNRGYWALYWTQRGNEGSQFLIEGTSFKVIVQNETQVEISFTRTWNSSASSSSNPSNSNSTDGLPLNFDIRYVMLKGSSGFYTYGIYEHLSGWPDFNLNRTRVAFKLRKDKFQYMAISKTRQRRMPLPEDREPPRGEVLQFKEATLLVDPVEPELKGQVDDKYMYAKNNEDIKVHGWVSSDPPVGFWHITASDEYRGGGPLKQDLTSHVGPISLTVFFSSHYMGQDKIPMFGNGEPWKKVYGPVFLYLNSAPPGTNESALWDDANEQLQQEAHKWPYSFIASTDYPKSDQRGTVNGRILVRDRFVSKEDIPAVDAYVGLALPGEVGSWKTEYKGYQFWTRSGPHGSFTIKNVHSGDYNLYAWVPGFIGDYKYDNLITVQAGMYIYITIPLLLITSVLRLFTDIHPFVIKTGDSIELDDDLVYEPPRNGTTLWEIGIPDRTAAEFFIPDVDPKYVNPLYLTQDSFRQYGLWEQYSVLYPKTDLVYTVNSSTYQKDWFYAQVTRKLGDDKYNSTTWQINFNLDSVDQGTIYKLRVAIASTTGAELQIRLNDLNTEIPHFTTGGMYKDNAIARYGIHGLYLLFNVDVKSDWLKDGENTIFLSQVRGEGPFKGIMYDYIRLEAPADDERTNAEARLYRDPTNHPSVNLINSPM
ncbi:probable rhamnogalacturonate lyase B isoform X1 [Papaver somniferum]|uniref:probable rhamnogalacturonate lyase B isoform X1 n=1 Tax=Papaver somniferum TaxID=3469 RepID=UPI000E6F4C4D|nr:probable rhamnogalacturonate lyase B isoform X1 [Papaver somniferum]